MKNAFITELAVMLKCTGTPTGIASSFTLATPNSG
jgi:hypothetical protein